MTDLKWLSSRRREVEKCVSLKCSQYTVILFNEKKFVRYQKLTDVGC